MESKLILPAHMKHVRAYHDDPDQHGLWVRWQQKFANGFENLIDPDFRAQLRQSRDEVERRLFATLNTNGANLPEADQLVRHWVEGQQWVMQRRPHRLPLSPRALYWRNKRFRPGPIQRASAEPSTHSTGSNKTVME